MTEALLAALSRIWTVGDMVAAQPIDFRKGVHGLVALVAAALESDPYCGDVFIFRSKRSGNCPGPGLTGSPQFVSQGMDEASVLPPSVGTLLSLLGELQARNRLLEEQNALLTARVAELERRLGQDSSNSNQPPSSDGPWRAPRRTGSLREKGLKKSGGQPWA